MQDALQSSSDFFYVREDECLDDYHEAIDDWPLVDPRTIDCNGRETQVYQESFFCTLGLLILVILFFDILLRNNSCFVLEYLFVYEPVQLGSVVPETIVDL